ncbi:MAG: hypothetical protein QM831_44885 [Kofleriaceae bacterium]
MGAVEMRKVILVTTLMILGCRKENPHRLFVVRPVDASKAAAIWFEEGGANPTVGMLDASFKPLWQQRLQCDVETSSLNATKDNVVVVCMSSGSWKLKYFSAQDGHSLAGASIEQFNGSRIAPRIDRAGDLVVLSNRNVILAVDETTEVRWLQQLDPSHGFPSISAGNATYYKDGKLKVTSLETQRMLSDDEWMSCYDDGNLFGLPDPFHLKIVKQDKSVSILTLANKVDGRIEDCGRFDGGFVLTVSGAEAKSTQVLFVKSDSIANSIDIPGADATMRAHWRGVSGLNGTLSRRVPLVVSSQGAYVMHILDLRDHTSTTATPLPSEALVFAYEGQWVVGAENEIWVIDGTNGSFVRRKLGSDRVPVLEPADIVQGDAWVLGSSWTTGSFALERIKIKTLQTVE